MEEEKLGRTQESRKRREQLAKLVLMVGMYGLPSYEQLGHQYNVSKMQISKDFKAILKNMPKLDYEEVRSSIEASLKSSYQVAVQLLMRSQHEDAGTVQKAVATYLAVIHELINYTTLIRPEPNSDIKFIIETVGSIKNIGVLTNYIKKKEGIDNSRKEEITTQNQFVGEIQGDSEAEEEETKEKPEEEDVLYV